MLSYRHYVIVLNITIRVSSSSRKYSIEKVDHADVYL